MGGPICMGPQYLVYTSSDLYKEAPIYIYSISKQKQRNIIKKLNVVKRPFSSEHPHLVFNQEYSSLEIIGDRYDDKNSAHFHLQIDRANSADPVGNHKPIKFQQSLYVADRWSKLVYKTFNSLLSQKP